MECVAPGESGCEDGKPTDRTNFTIKLWEGGEESAGSLRAMDGQLQV